MGAPDILAQLHAVGVNLSRRGDKLIATPKASVTPEIVDLLRAHKPELLAALTTPKQAGGPQGAKEAKEGGAAPANPANPAEGATKATEATKGGGVTRNAAAEAELRQLVNKVADHRGFSPDDRREALEIALSGDLTSALACFRALAAQYGYGNTAKTPLTKYPSKTADH